MRTILILTAGTVVGTALGCEWWLSLLVTFLALGALVLALDADGPNIEEAGE